MPPYALRMVDKNAQNPALPDTSTAADRANYIVQRLEQFIRDGSKDEQGMSFERWKQMARSEIAIAIAEAEISQSRDELASKRVLFVAGAAMVTIGFWGAVASLGKIDYLLGAAICGLAGVILMMAVGQWRFRSWSERKQAKKRREALGRIENLNRRIKRLEKELESEAEDLEDLMAKATRRKRVLSPGQDR